MARVLVPLAQGCEELEAVTIIDLLRRGEVDVVTAGLDGNPVRASRGTVLVPDTTLEEVQDRDFDMIVLPGGMPGMENLKGDGRLRSMLEKADSDGRYIAAICASPVVLAEAGILKGKRAVCYPGFDLPGAEISDDPVVRDGKVITSRGPGTAMDFSLELLEILAGRSKRDQVEAALQR